MIKKQELIELVKKHISESNSITDLLGKNLQLSTNGSNCKLIRKIIEDENLDTSHFRTLIKPKRKYELIDKKCKICNNTFVVSSGSKKEKNYCSVSCSNNDRVVSEETKIKLSSMSFGRHKLKLLNKKYGENVISNIIELRNENKTYDEITNSVKEITKDDMKILFKIFDLNILKNNNVFLLNNEDVKNKYLELHNLKKVAIHFGVSFSTIKNIIPNELIEENKFNRNKNKKSKSEVVIDWRKRKKLELVEYKGGKCQCCEYNKSIKALEFHHINPKEKDFTISGKSYSFERLKNEVDKCVLVCSNCHIEIHDELNERGESEIVNKIVNKK